MSRANSAALWLAYVAAGALCAIVFDAAGAQIVAGVAFAVMLAVATLGAFDDDAWEWVFPPRGGRQ